MARAEDRAESAAEEDDARSGSSSGGDDSDGCSGSGYDSDSSDGSSNTDGSEDGEEEEGEDDVKAEEAAAAAKKQLVRADIVEMRAMMADMDAVKARLQQRFAAERQARLERIAREVQDADCRRAEQDARSRHVEMAVQTETVGPQQETNLSQQSSRPSPHLAESAASVAAATLPAVDGGAGFAGAAPNKSKPAGLSLYDLVKASGFGLSRKENSPVRQARSSNEHELVSPEQQQQQLHKPESSAKRDWGVADSHLTQVHDSIVNGSRGDASDGGASDIHASSNRDHHQMRSRGGHAESLDYDENSSSMSNSLVSSDVGKRSALLSDPVQRRDHKLDAAALLSSGRYALASSAANVRKDKTDEQREMEAIQCLLFGRRSRR
jgi:hypothetical protein